MILVKLVSDLLKLDVEELFIAAEIRRNIASYLPRLSFVVFSLGTVLPVIDPT